MTERLVNLCCGHATCQHLVAEALADAWAQGAEVGANEAHWNVGVAAKNPYREERS